MVADGQELAFLSAIHAAPRDDAPRLIFADWLEERGDPLAELIRWQVLTKKSVAVYVGRRESRLAGLLGPEGGIPFDEARFAESILPAAKRWLRPFPSAAQHAKPQIYFKRGIPCIEWSGNCTHDLSSLDALCRIRIHFRASSLFLPLHRMTVLVDAVFRHPALSRIDRLAVPIVAQEEALVDFIARLADTDLPERLECFSLVGLGSSYSPGEFAIVRRAKEVLSGRMRVIEPPSMRSAFGQSPPTTPVR